jgi:hypothetical protein
MSEPFVAVCSELSRSGAVTTESASLLCYLVDGQALSFPLAKKTTQRGL